MSAAPLADCGLVARLQTLCHRILRNVRTASVIRRQRWRRSHGSVLWCNSVACQGVFDLSESDVAIGEDPDQETRKSQHGTDGTRGSPAQPFANGDAAQERAERVGGVER